MSAYTFLTATWQFLVLVTYRVPVDVLQPFCPPHCAPERFNGSGLVSLVCFQFTHCKVLGIGWPGYRNFPEVNLRFYVTHGHERGVCFIKEYVPQRLVAFLARQLYHEPYETMPKMSSQIDMDDTIVTALYTFGAFSCSIEAANTPFTPDEHTLEHALKEQQWGFGKTKNGLLLRYEVLHPVWQIYPINRYDLHVDFGKLYGARWSFLNQQEPLHLTLARGSHIRVTSLATSRT